ncbi:MAG: PQQ-dependent sugar dehydrogenase [Planctomycetes bacterium]|nr:PQQ-dependent sugar dehydrogenase [Planctomycetota bacterium]
MNRSQIGAAVLSVSALAGAVSAQTISLTTVATGVTRPIAVEAPAGDFSRIFIAEQRGSAATANRADVRILNLSTNTFNASPFLTISAGTVGFNVSTSSEQGLLGLAFDPNYASNGFVYVYFTTASVPGVTIPGGWSGGVSVLARLTRSAGNPDVVDYSTFRIVWAVPQPQSNHNGGWIDFGPDGNLYWALGDGGGANDSGTGHTATFGNAQDLTNHLGKIHRINPNGADGFPADPVRNYAIPAGNPFAGGAQPEIYVYGVRNPFRNDIDPATGDLYIADVGQNLWEEITVQPIGNANGDNYGWRCYEGNNAFNTSNCPPAGSLIFPQLVYGHSSSIAPTFHTGCSLTGGVVYRGCAFPELDGTYFFIDYCTGSLFRSTWNGTALTNVINLQPTVGTLSGVTSFGRDALGEVYICSQGAGSVLRITRSGGPALADCNGNSRPDACDLRSGVAADTNSNNIPDSCEPAFPASLVSPSNGQVGVAVNPTLAWSPSSNAATYSVVVATDPGLTNVVTSATGLAGTSWIVNPNLSQGVTYYWGVTAVNPNGSNASLPSNFSFTTITPPPCPGDLNGDGQRNTADLTLFLGAFGKCPADPGYNAAADLAPADPCINTADLAAFLGVFGVPCP